MKYNKRVIIKRLKNPKFLYLLAAAVLAVFFQLFTPLQDWVSANVTFIQKWEENTNMPSGVLIFFGILVIGSFIYLILDAIKESDTEKIDKKMDGLSKKMDRHFKDLTNELKALREDLKEGDEDGQ